MKRAFFEEPKFDLIYFSGVDVNAASSGIGDQEVGDDDERDSSDR